MEKRTYIVPLLVFVTVMLTATAAHAFSFEDRCIFVCGGGASCEEGCLFAGQGTTCAEFWGNPANDYDSDGVNNSADNCRCTPNSNQANCDGDSWGDACDSVDNSWYLYQTSTATCYVDVDNHFLYETMEMYGKKVYRSACTGATCVKNLLLTDFDCFPDADLSCCDGHWDYFSCRLPWNYDNCGQPKCSF